MSECPNCHTVFDYVGDMQTAVQRASRAEAEVDRLRAELSQWKDDHQMLSERLVAVVALCDKVDWRNGRATWPTTQIRAAATGDPQ